MHYLRTLLRKIFSLLLVILAWQLGAVSGSLALSDPTRPKVPSEILAWQGDKDKLVVRMIKYENLRKGNQASSEHTAQAYVNATWVRVGDLVNEAQVVQIAQDRVVFRLRNGVLTSIPVSKYNNNRERSNGNSGNK